MVAALALDDPGRRRRPPSPPTDATAATSRRRDRSPTRPRPASTRPRRDGNAAAVPDRAPVVDLAERAREPARRRRTARRRDPVLLPAARPARPRPRRRRRTPTRRPRPRPTRRASRSRRAAASTARPPRDARGRDRTAHRPAPRPFAPARAAAARDRRRDRERRRRRRHRGRASPPPPAEQLVSVLTPLRTQPERLVHAAPRAEAARARPGRDARRDARRRAARVDPRRAPRSRADRCATRSSDLRDRLGAEGVRTGDLTVSDGGVGARQDASGTHAGVERAGPRPPARPTTSRPRRQRRPRPRRPPVPTRRRCSTSACEQQEQTMTAIPPASIYSTPSTASDVDDRRHQPAEPGHVPEAARRADEVPGPAVADRQHAVPHPDRAVHPGEHAATDR